MKKKISVMLLAVLFFVYCISNQDISEDVLVSSALSGPETSYYEIKEMEPLESAIVTPFNGSLSGLIREERVSVTRNGKYSFLMMMFAETMTAAMHRLFTALLMSLGLCLACRQFVDAWKSIQNMDGKKKFHALNW